MVTTAPVQRRSNGRAGWTQGLELRPDGRFLHITSSGGADAVTNASKNEILFASAKSISNDNEAEDAVRQGTALHRDPSVSNGAKVRLGAKMSAGSVAGDEWGARIPARDLGTRSTGNRSDLTATARLKGGREHDRHRGRRVCA